MAENLDTEKPDVLRMTESQAQGETRQINELRRDFKPRQVFMFSIACAIGTGLVIGTGTALSRGGPGSLLIAYLLIGCTVFFVMAALGEMATFLPMNKGFGGYATRMVDPAFGFATGWNYFFKYIIATPTNLTAAGLVIQYWRPALYGLAKDGQAPRLFAKARENGNPIFAVAFTCMFISLGYMNASKSSSTVFGYLVSLVTVFAVLNWVAILITHIRFRQALKAQRIAASDLPYVGALQPYGSYFALLILLLVIVFNGYDAFIPHFKVDVFILKYLGIILFLLNIALWKITKRKTFWSATEVDLFTGKRQFEERESAEDGNWKDGIWKRMTRRIRR